MLRQYRQRSINFWNLFSSLLHFSVLQWWQKKLDSGPFLSWNNSKQCLHSALQSPALLQWPLLHFHHTWVLSNTIINITIVKLDNIATLFKSCDQVLLLGFQVLPLSNRSCSCTGGRRQSLFFSYFSSIQNLVCVFYEKQNVMQSPN